MTHRTKNRFRATAELSFNRSEANHSFTYRRLSGNLKPDWWSPLRRGLIIEPSAKHHKQMKQAVWLYLYFLLNADSQTGMLFRKLSTVSTDTGVPKRTIRRWFKILRNRSYVRADYNGSFWRIAINKWRPISNHPRKKRGWFNRLKQNLFSGKSNGF